MKVSTIRFYYMVDKQNINYLKYIIEAYDNIAVITTLDSEKGLLVVYIASGCEELLVKIIKDLSKTISIKLIDYKDNT